MDKFPVLWQSEPVGELKTEREALYTWFTVRCRLPDSGLWCAWAVGEEGTLRIGVLEPSNGQAAIRRRFSQRLTAPLGRLLRGEVRPTGEAEENDWKADAEAERLFQTAWIRKHLQGVRGVLTKGGAERWIALPYDPQKPFPLQPLFCFASLRWISGRPYVVYRFDEKEWPRMPTEKK